jgi:MFS family permease
MTGPSRPVHYRPVPAICCFGVGVTGIKITIVNVALPSISRDLNASVGSRHWKVSTYSVVMACLLLLSGSVADRFGRRRIFPLGLSLLPFGPLLCGLASSHATPGPVPEAADSPRSRSASSPPAVGPRPPPLATAEQRGATRYQ